MSIWIKVRVLEYEFKYYNDISYVLVQGSYEQSVWQIRFKYFNRMFIEWTFAIFLVKLSDPSTLNSICNCSLGNTHTFENQNE